MIEKLTVLDRYSGFVESTDELAGLRLVKVPIGTFAGTQERIFAVEAGQTIALNLGDQGSGQN